MQDCCDPKQTAACVKTFLKTGKVIDTMDWDVVVEPAAEIKAFNPNADHSLLMIGDSAAANAIWLRNWRDIGLKRAKEILHLQVVVQGGPSVMQMAEQSMWHTTSVSRCSSSFATTSNASPPDGILNPNSKR